MLKKKHLWVVVPAILGVSTAYYVMQGDNGQPDTATLAELPATERSSATQSPSLGSAGQSGAALSVAHTVAPPFAVPPLPPVAHDPITNAASLYPKSAKHQNEKPVFLKPGKEVVLVDAYAARDLVLQDGKEFFNIGPNDSLQLARSSRDNLGNAYYKYEQTFQNLPVHGKEVVVQVDDANNLQVVAGNFESSIDIDINPGMTGEAALQQAIQHLAEAPVATPTVHEKPELAVYVSADVSPTLAYRSAIEYVDKESGMHLEQVYINANTGEILNTYTRLHSALKREIHNVSGNCLRRNNDLPGPLSFGEQGASNADSHEQAAYDNTGTSYWFFFHFLKRDSFDGQGATLKSTVRATFTSEGSQSCHGNNAFFAGAPQNQMIYGQGSQSFNNPASALDITGHELGHGVTFATSNLVYQDESGAINEAVSDIYGAGVEAWKDSGGSASGNPSGGIQASADTWKAGEDAVAVSRQRRMNNPTADNYSVDNYGDLITGSGDNGGVHGNSGIMNLAFYLLSEGGAHPRSSISSNEVSGIGIEKALKIYYLAATQLFTSSTNFEAARGLVAQAAETLHGECSPEWEAVHQSFDAVKVPGTWTACDTGGGDTGGGDTGGGDTGGGDTGGGDTGGGDTGGGDTGGGDTGGGDTGGGDTGGGDTGGGANVALSGVASASSAYSPFYAAKLVNDGDSSSFWASSTIFNPNRTEWAAIDFASAKTVSEVTIDWSSSGYPGVFGVWVFNGSWQQVAELSKFGPGTDTVSFDPVSSQSVAVTMAYGPYGRWYIIKELEVR